MPDIADRIAVYRRMTSVDLDTVMAIETAIYLYPWTRGNFEDSLSAGYHCWIMKCADQVAGYGVVMMALDEAHLLNLSVAVAWQRRGLGRQMLNFLIGHARTLLADRIFLEVRPSNIAGYALYAVAGFKEIGRRRGYYPAGAQREDAVVMEMRIA